MNEDKTSDQPRTPYNSGGAAFRSIGIIVGVLVLAAVLILAGLAIANGLLRAVIPAAVDQAPLRLPAFTIDGSEFALGAIAAILFLIFLVLLGMLFCCCCGKLKGVAGLGTLLRPFVKLVNDLASALDRAATAADNIRSGLDLASTAMQNVSNGIGAITVAMKSPPGTRGLSEFIISIVDPSGVSPRVLDGNFADSTVTPGGLASVQTDMGTFTNRVNDARDGAGALKTELTTAAGLLRALATTLSGF
jgi:hypothetical protein